MPWAVIVGKILRTKDVRKVGDGNPGAVNAWKSGGYVPGILSVTLEICKSLVPIYLAKQHLDGFASGWAQIGFAMVAFAPILGHAWSPFLRFHGGKALATTWGSWIGGFTSVKHSIVNFYPSYEQVDHMNRLAGGNF